MPLWQAFTKEANVSDPKEQHEPEELDLDQETVRDLDPSDEASGVRGRALEPYLNLKGQKQGALTADCPH